MNEDDRQSCEILSKKIIIYIIYNNSHEYKYSRFINFSKCKW